MNITLYHRAGTRSERVKRLLALLGLPHALREVDAAFAASPTYRALHPFGTVPTLEIDGRVLIESAGQLLALADLAPEAGLAPPPGCLERAAYYDGFIFAVATLEPAVVAWMGAPEEPTRIAYRDEALDALEGFVGNPFTVGERLTALDVLLHWALSFLLGQGLLEGRPRARAAQAGLHEVLMARGAF